MLKDVLASTNSAEMQQVARYIGASVLNVASPGLLGTPPVFTLPMLKNMWAEYRMTNGFRPTAGATPWNWTQIVNYLKSTMVLP
jgi:hypothetical protein